MVGLEHFHEEADHGARGVELAALAAFGQCELLQEVLVDAAEHVGGSGLGPTDLDVAHQVDHLPQAGLVQGGTGVVLGQHVPQRRVIPLNGGHGVVHSPPYGGLVRLALKLRPPGLGRHPEDVLGDVLVPVLGGVFTPFGEHLSVALLEGVGDVLEEDQAEDDVLVLGGVHAAP